MLENPSVIDTKVNPKEQESQKVEKSPFTIASNVYSQLKGTYDSKGKIDNQKLSRDEVNSFLAWAIQQQMDTVSNETSTNNNSESVKYFAILENSNTTLSEFLSSNEVVNPVGLFMRRCVTEGSLQQNEAKELKSLILGLNRKLVEKQKMAKFETAIKNFFSDVEESEQMEIRKSVVKKFWDGFVESINGIQSDSRFATEDILQNSGITFEEMKTEYRKYIIICGKLGYLSQKEVLEIDSLIQSAFKNNAEKTIQQEYISELKSMNFDSLIEKLSNQYLDQNNKSDFLGLILLLSNPNYPLNLNIELQVVRDKIVSENIAVGIEIAKTTFDNIKSSQSSGLVKLKMDTWKKEIGI